MIKFFHTGGFLNIAEKHLELKREVGTLIGPFCILLTVSISFLKPEFNHLSLPWIAAIGMFLSWKWKLKGLGFSIGILAGILAFRFTSFTPDERLWEIGLSLALTLGFVTTALSDEEIEEKEIIEPDPSLVEKIEHLQSQIEKKEAQLNSYEKLMDLAREEALAGKDRLEKMRLDLGKQKQRAKAEQDKIEEELKNANRELNKLRPELSETKNKISKLEAVLKEPPVTLPKPMIVTIEKEKGEHWENFRRYEGLYNQLRVQFEEKSALLDSSRKEIFHLQEKIESLQRENRDSLANVEKEYEEYIVKMERYFQQEICQLRNECEQQEELITQITHSQRTG